MLGELWFWVSAIIVLVVILFGVPFGMIKSTGINRKVIIIANSIMIGIIAAVFLLGFTNEQIYSRYEDDYKKESGGFFGSFKYIDTIDGYHVFSYHNWGRGDEIAVPADKCDVPALSHIYPNVIVFYENNEPLYSTDEIITLNGKNYHFSTSIVAVFTEYTDLILLTLLIDVPILFTFNLTEMIILLIGLKKRTVGSEQR